MSIWSDLPGVINLESMDIAFQIKDSDVFNDVILLMYDMCDDDEVRYACMATLAYLHIMRKYSQFDSDVFFDMYTDLVRRIYS